MWAHIPSHTTEGQIEPRSFAPCILLLINIPSLLRIALASVNFWIFRVDFRFLIFFAHQLLFQCLLIFSFLLHFSFFLFILFCSTLLWLLRKEVQSHCVHSRFIIWNHALQLWWVRISATSLFDCFVDFASDVDHLHF